MQVEEDVTVRRDVEATHALRRRVVAIAPVLALAATRVAMSVAPGHPICVRAEADTIAALDLLPDTVAASRRTVKSGTIETDAKTSVVVAHPSPLMKGTTEDPPPSLLAATDA